MTLKQIITTIERMPDHMTFRKGCTFGDTEYSSEAVVYGYGLAIADVLRTLKKVENTQVPEDKMEELAQKYATEKGSSLYGDAYRHYMAGMKAANALLQK